MRPARAVVTRSPHRTVGVVHAQWLQPEPIEHESFLERRFVDMAITCPAVAAIRHQAFRLEYSDAAGQQRSYVPDYALTLVGGARLVVEVKPRVFVEKSRAKLEAACAVLRSRGLAYYVVTDEHMPESAAEEARTWRRYARSVPAVEAVGPALVHAAEGAGVTVDDLRRRDIALPVIYHLLGRRRLVTVGERLTLTSQTRLRTFPNEEPFDARLCFDTWFGCSPW